MSLTCGRRETVYQETTIEGFYSFSFLLER